MNVLYQQRDFPIFQNRMYGSREEAINCPKGDVVLIENELTGLVYNAAFRSEMISRLLPDFTAKSASLQILFIAFSNPVCGLSA